MNVYFYECKKHGGRIKVANDRAAVILAVAKFGSDLLFVYRDDLTVVYRNRG